MKGKPRWLVVLQAGLFSMTIALTGCENGNLFGGFNDRGDSGDVESLNADASIFLRERNFSEALKLYQRTLAQDPDNSEALYGAATAAMGTSGLSLGVLVANLTNELNAPVINNLGDLVSVSRDTISPQNTNDANSILFGVAIEALNGVIDNVICWLSLIVGGVADGTINPNDPNNAFLLLDLGLVCIIRGVLRFIRQGWGDLTNVNGEYQFTIDPDLTTAICNDPIHQPTIVQIARDVVGAFALFKRTVDLLALSGDQVIVDLRDEINDGLQQLLLDDSGTSQILPQACIALLAANDITTASFASDTTVFDNPPSSCPAL